MAKYVKCIDNSGIPFTEGNCYTVINADIICYLLRDDSGLENWWNKGMFEEPYELPEPITFASQEDFENAVMEVVMKRLNVFFADNSDPWGGKRNYCHLEDK